MKQINTEKRARHILKKGYVRRLAPDESGGFVASILEFPGCFAEGNTADEALQNLDAAAESWIEVAMANGQHVREPIDFDGFSGKLALRLPRTLHKQAAELAELEGCSLNQLLVSAIAHYVGGKQLASEVETWMQPLKLINLNFNNIRIVASAGTAFSPKLLETEMRPGKIYSTIENSLKSWELVHG